MSYQVLMRLIGLIMLLLLPPLTVEAQKPGKVPTIGLLSPPPGAYVAAFEEAFASSAMSEA